MKHGSSEDETFELDSLPAEIDQQSDLDAGGLQNELISLLLAFMFDAFPFTSVFVPCLSVAQFRRTYQQRINTDETRKFR